MHFKREENRVRGGPAFSLSKKGKRKTDKLTAERVIMPERWEQEERITLAYNLQRGN